MLSEFWQESYRNVVMKSKTTSNIRSFCNKVLSDVKKELNDTDPNVKTHALMKLLFLHVQGYDIKWASKITLDVISTCGSFGKRIGYMIGQLQLKNDKIYLQLIPNMIKKEFQLKKENTCSISLALSFLNTVLNQDLSLTLVSELEKLLNVNNNQIRKKLIITLTKMNILINNKQRIEEYLLVLAKMLEKNEELSQGSIISIISSIQQISHLYPELAINIFIPIWNYFKKLENNNWCLIKIIDIFNCLSQKARKDLLQSAQIVNHFGQLFKTKISKSVSTQLTKLLILNLEQEKYPELFAICEEKLISLINFDDINLVLIALRMLNKLFSEGKLSKTSKKYLDQVIKLIDKGQTERVKEYERLNSLKKKGENLSKYELMSLYLYGDKVHEECLKIIKFSVDKQNFKLVCEKILESIGLHGENRCQENELLIELEGTKKYSMINLPSSVLNLIDKTTTIQTFLDIVSANKYDVLNSDLKNFEWFVDKLFLIAEDQFEKKIENKVAFILRDLCLRIKSIRKLILNKAQDLLTKLLNKKIAIFTIDNSIDKSLSYFPIYQIFENESFKEKNNCLIESILYIIGEYFDEKADETTILQLLNYLKNEKLKNSFFSCLSNCAIKILIRFPQILSKIEDELKIIFSSNDDIGNIETSFINFHIIKLLNSKDTKKLENLLFEEFRPSINLIENNFFSELEELKNMKIIIDKSEIESRVEGGHISSSNNQQNDISTLNQKVEILY